MRAPLPARSTGLPCRGPRAAGGHPPFITAASCLGDRGALVPVCFRNSALIPSPREPLGEESGLAPAGLWGEQGQGGTAGTEHRGWAPTNPPCKTPGVCQPAQGPAPAPWVLTGPSLPFGAHPTGLHPMLGDHRAEPHASAGGVRSPFNPLLGACLNQALLAPQAKSGFAQCPLLPGASGGGQGAPLAPRSPGVHTSLSGSRLASC